MPEGHHAPGGPTDTDEDETTEYQPDPTSARKTAAPGRAGKRAGRKQATRESGARAAQSAAQSEGGEPRARDARPTDGGGKKARTARLGGSSDGVDNIRDALPEDDSGDSVSDARLESSNESEARAARPRRGGNRKSVPTTFTPGVRTQLGKPAATVSWRESLRESWSGVARTLRPAGVRVRDDATRVWQALPKSREQLREVGPKVRDEVRRQAPVTKAWARQHRVLLAGLMAVVVFAGADSTLARIPTDAAVEPGVAQRVPVAYPLQVQAPAATAKRYLDAINSGEKLREAAVVAAAARSTLERAKAEAAAAVAGENSPWLNSGADSGGALPPGFVLPGAGGYVLPAIGAFTSGFGQRWGTFHAGIDIAAPLGSPIYAVAAGTVIDAGPAQGFGLWVRIRHDDGSISIYGHMYDFFVSVGERVPAGLQIARIGNRGDSTGPHLHFEVVIDGQHVDPQRWLALHGLSLG
ncbi:M23 family metallopeptidase [Nocardia sp. NPDC050406]|uniref:M23 family metallopeptidase n=1 Tax=Nocardia sp. NPDC050406 TaxID=3364318 RepID=UPI00378AFE62